MKMQYFVGRYVLLHINTFGVFKAKKRQISLILVFLSLATYLEHIEEEIVLPALREISDLSYNALQI